MTVDIDTFLRRMGAVANGDLLAGPNGPDDRFTLTRAQIEDWLECLELARGQFSTGSKTVPAGMTWEEALAFAGARMLRSGAGPQWPPMGAPAEWDEDERAWWVGAVHFVADEGSTHHAPDRTPTGMVSVQGAGRVTLASLPRSPR